MTNFKYTKNIPHATNNPSNDQPIMEVNANSISDLIGVDHHGFNDNNGGWHQQVTLVGESLPASAAQQFVLYNQPNPSVGNSSELWSARDGNGAVSNFAFTSARIANPLASTNGVTFLPGPQPNGAFFYQWGQATSIGTSLPNTTVLFPQAYLATVYSVVCTILTTADSRFFVELYDLSNTQFRAVTRDSGGSKTSGVTFCWMAIGQ